MIRTLTIACILSIVFPKLVDLAPAHAESDTPVTLFELRRIIETQQKQIEQQAKLLSQLQSRVEQLSAVASRAEQQSKEAATRLNTNSTARQAIGVTSGQGKVNLKVYGQVNRGVLYADDGSRSEFFNVDNDNSSTRFGLEGLANVTKDLTLGSRIEVQFESNSTASVNQITNNGVGSNTFTKRKLEIYARSKKFGKLSVGQGSTASDGTAEVDLSRTGVIAYSGIQDMAGGILFRNSQTNSLTMITIGGVYDQLDGLGRNDRIRYDTPALSGGSSLSTSYTGNDSWDVALRWGGHFGGTKVAAAASYADPSSASSDGRIVGSASLLFKNGLNLTVAGGQDSPETASREDPAYWYVKVGYIFNLLSFGETAFAFDYARADNIAQSADDFDTFGVFAVQRIADYGTEFYLGFRRHDLNRTGTVTDEILSVLSGARVKF